MRILIADDYGIVRQGLRSMIEQYQDMEVVGEARDGIQVLNLVDEVSPDIIIMDISMPNMNGIEATRAVLRKKPDAKIIALSMHSNRRFVSEMLKAGALGYVLKSYLFDELLRAIQAVARNERYLSPRITNLLVEDYLHGTSDDQQDATDTLSQRERHIIQMLAEGKTTKQIANQLNISPKTADANRRQVMNKLGLNSLAELTKYAIREGLTSLEF